MASTQGTQNNVTPVDSTGTPVALAGDGSATLTAGQTYYFPLSDGTALCQSVHMKWGPNIIATITFEDSNFNDPSNFDATSGNWIKEDPISAYVAVVGTGCTASGMTVSTPGGGASAGGAVYNIGNIATRRQRLKVVVGGTGGTLRVALHGKQ